MLDRQKIAALAREVTDCWEDAEDENIIGLFFSLGLTSAAVAAQVMLNLEEEGEGHYARAEFVEKLLRLVDEHVG